MRETCELLYFRHPWTLISLYNNVNFADGKEVQVAASGTAGIRRHRPLLC